MDMTNHSLAVDTCLTLGERFVRFALGMAFIASVFLHSGYLGWYGLLALAAIPLIASASIGWDPLYAVFNAMNARLAKRAGQRNNIQLDAWYATPQLTPVDRAVRSVFAAALIATLLASTGPVEWRGLLALFSIPIITTSIIALCPCYALIAKLRRHAKPAARRHWSSAETVSRPTMPWRSYSRQTQPV